MCLRKIYKTLVCPVLCHSSLYNQSLSQSCGAMAVRRILSEAIMFINVLCKLVRTLLNPYSAKGLGNRLYAPLHKMPGEVGYSFFFLFGNGTFIEILNLSSHICDFSLSMADIYRAVSKVVSGPRPTWSTTSSDNPIYHASRLSGRVQSSLRATSDVNYHEIMQPRPWATVRYEFTLHCYLLGNISIISSPFWQQWFQIMRNSKH